ncbi:hypothetical protein BO94DRAFT_73798 [Aspergillus sclerotioniger CBS 115572]|uniref:Uncharacterized protein n=1 Tax=Aspergillus sclerotioniger CBS 115572 TaxID=1450535 RepID=A0A317WLC0_9EURO|nr:hypothetical protein BO94DRAFT_73798 [Aspergillus sclerotioniger CBS 115572]PWY87296.1 hypothetical protein BO94DRAFT_73798 [Aspergillus sclerotioniger CBS 115572]
MSSLIDGRILGSDARPKWEGKLWDVWEEQAIPARLPSPGSTTEVGSECCWPAGKEEDPLRTLSTLVQLATAATNGSQREPPRAPKAHHRIHEPSKFPTPTHPPLLLPPHQPSTPSSLSTLSQASFPIPFSRRLQYFLDVKVSGLTTCTVSCHSSDSQ